MRVKGAFRSPQLSARFRKKPGKLPDNPTHAASFLRQFRPRKPAVRPVWGKKGAFSPASPAQTRLFTRRPPFVPPDHPAVRPGPARFPPGARPEPAARASPAPRQPPTCARFSARSRHLSPPKPRLRRQPAVFRPQPRRNPPAKPRPKPRLGRARRQRRPPPPERPRQGTPAGWATPTALVGFPASPWRSVRPKGGSDPWA